MATSSPRNPSAALQLDTTHAPALVPAHGAYGLRVDGLPDTDAWMASCDAHAFVGRLGVEVRVGVSGPDRSSLDHEVADLRLVGGGRLQMRRGDPRALFFFPEPPFADELVHPWLAPAAAVWHLWAGREAFHGGAFVSPAGAILLLAAKAGGKSTTLAWLSAELGCTVLSDDLLILTDGGVWAGPRCLDLRSRAQGFALDLSSAPLVRRGERLRVLLATAPARMPVAGIVELAWGSDVTLQRVAPASRLATLLAHRMFAGLLPGDNTTVLDLVTRPMLRLTRPRGDRGMRNAAAALLDYFS